MKRYVLLSVLTMGLFLIGIPAAKAQNHGEVGVFGELFRLNTTAGTGFSGLGGGTNFGGLGARVGLGMKWLQWEGEVGYDFTHTVTEGFANPTTGAVSLTSSNLRILHGMFGPKIQIPGPVRLFVTAKGGAINFRFDPTPASFSTFTSSFSSLRTSNVDGVFYVGGGAEAYLGPIGLRFDVGDEMYFDAGTHHDLRITFGPHLRF